MKYLKLVNCPIRGLFPEKENKSIDWKAVGLDPTDVARFSTQGFDDEKKENYVSIFPIADESKLMKSGIIDQTNDNSNPNDSAEIISPVKAKTAIKKIKKINKVVIKRSRENATTK